jgi:YggT family protein
VSGLITLYSLFIVVRILLSWFSGVRFGRVFSYLCRITDPYLLWFRRWRIFQAGPLDLSPIAALAVLTVVNNIITKIAASGRVTIGFILALLLSVVWAALSFCIGFFVVIVALRLIAYLVSADMYAPFWKIIDMIARPVIFTINRTALRGVVRNYFASILVTLAVLIVLFAALSFTVNSIATPLLLSLPL